MGIGVQQNGGVEMKTEFRLSFALASQHSVLHTCMYSESTVSEMPPIHVHR